ncbi:MAG: diacylglycerol kinase [Trueperaceae bacterium]|nr:diacylglycerol kinase [Trueperaceae bacterium]
MTRPSRDPIGVRHAARGVRDAVRHERNLRIELAIGGAAVGAALALDAPLLPIVIAATWVLSLELLNTAVEAVVDLHAPAPHPLARRAKDAAAGAVLVAAAGAVLVGLLVLGPPLAARLAPGGPS